MIQGRPHPPLSWPARLGGQVHRSRQRVVRSAAQYTLYFLLGLAVISLFIGLGVFLAGETTALNMRIRGLEGQCEKMEWKIAELVSDIALETNIEEIERYAQDHGFIDAQEFVYLGPVEADQRAQDVAATRGPLVDTPEGDREPTLESSTWQTALHRLRELVPRLGRGGPSLEQGGHVAPLR